WPAWCSGRGGTNRSNESYFRFDPDQAIVVTIRRSQQSQSHSFSEAIGDRTCVCFVSEEIRKASVASLRGLRSRAVCCWDARSWLKRLPMPQLPSPPLPHKPAVVRPLED